MASEVETMVAPPAAETEWNETDTIFSLARLQQIHIQLRQLRESVAQLVDSTLAQQSSPIDFYSNFSGSAQKTANEVKDFTKLLEDGRSKDILKRSKESQTIDPESIKAWIVTDHEDWLDVKADDIKDITAVEEEVEELNPTINTKVEDIRTVIEHCKKKHQEIEISIDENLKIKVYLRAPAHIHFEVESKIASENQNTYDVACKEKSQLHSAIVRAVVARPRPNDLDYLLEMLASYVDVKSRPCIKCHRLLDQNAQFPATRTRKRTKQSDGHFATQWEAFHHGCT